MGKRAESVERISTACMTQKEWEAERRKSIGGSDAGCVMGLNRWKSAYTLWAEKTGSIVPEDISKKESVRLGVELEDYVARRFCEATGKKVRRERAILRNPRYQFAHANVDRLVIGESAGLECKTTSALDMKRFRDVEFPTDYYCQCVHYLAVTGLDRWYLAVLVLGREFRVFCLERDQSEIDALMDAEANFWASVQRKTPPLFAGTEEEEETLETIIGGESAEGMADLTGLESALALYQAAAEQIREVKARQTAAKLEICQALGNMAGGWIGKTKITWKPTARKTFDAEKFQAEHPEINLGKYQKTTFSRVFKINTGKE